ncbi:MAG: molecular chaperone TorD family protein [Adlercreutzia equolifaciens]
MRRAPPSADSCQLVPVRAHRRADRRHSPIEIADGTAIDEGLRAIKEYLRHRHGGTQELAVDYARVFLGASYDRILAPPYESVPRAGASSCRMLATAR